MQQQQLKKNRGVVLVGKNQVEVQDVPYPSLEIEMSHGKKKNFANGIILKTVATNICGSDLHMLRSRIPVPQNFRLGHEITGIVESVGPHVEYIKPGMLVSVPFNISCGVCSNDKAGLPQACMNINPNGRPGAAFGYADMGDIPGGQSNYVMVPYADYNCLVIPQQDLAMQKILDVSMLSDILPTAFHGIVSAGVSPGKTVYIAGAGPVGVLAAACASELLGAVPIVGDVNRDRLARLRTMGVQTVDLSTSESLSDQLNKILGEPFVDCAVECVGFEAHAEGRLGIREDSSAPLNDCFQAVRVGGAVSVPGFYPPADPKNNSMNYKAGNLPIQFGTAWQKGINITGLGQCPVNQYNLTLLKAVLFGKIEPSKWLNTVVIPLDDAPAAYKNFNNGEAVKYVIDANNMIPANQRHRDAARSSAVESRSVH